MASQTLVGEFAEPSTPPAFRRSSAAPLFVQAYCAQVVGVHVARDRPRSRSISLLRRGQVFRTLRGWWPATNSAPSRARACQRCSRCLVISWKPMRFSSAHGPIHSVPSICARCQRLVHLLRPAGSVPKHPCCARARGPPRPGMRKLQAVEGLRQPVDFLAEPATSLRTRCYRHRNDFRPKRLAQLVMQAAMTIATMVVPVRSAPVAVMPKGTDR